MTTIIIFYILFLIIFLVISSLIFRHSVKFSYLSHRFQIIVGVFGIISLTIIIISIYLLFQLNGTQTTTNYYDYDTPPSTSTTTTDGLNF